MTEDSSNDSTWEIPPTGPPAPTPLPDHIGPYQILALLEEGGMGRVYLAEQGLPSRRVAIKIILPGKRSKEILARFDIEREALALMDHPNIAKVFDAGEADDGQPYFVMEYVHGIPITKYCDQNRLTTNQRLELFVQVCEAVHHAHQKGIIHRDIKPGNVLVAVQEDRPIPKVIDFGVAKAVGHRLTAKTLFTEQGQLLGTPGYMSPEQAEMSALDIDTRTDIYSLGVLLYELLVGAQPFETKKLLDAGFGEIQRVIREVDPPKPSTKFSSLGDDSTVVAQNRGTVVRSLSRELRGDLDWITMKCLEKDRVRRYKSATALAEDVVRHLQGRPVEAGPPSAIYKLRKFTRRHRVGVAAGLAIATAVVAGFVGTAMGYVRADRERVRADYEAETATQVKNFMIELFNVSDPSGAQGNRISAREILDRGAARIPMELSSRPQVRAAMMDAMGNVYLNLGLFGEAETLLRDALKMRRAELPAGHPDLASSLHHLGDVLNQMGRYEDAESCQQEGLAMRERLYGREHVATSESLAYLAEVAFNRDRRDEAAELYDEVLRIRTRLLPPKDPSLGAAFFDLGQIAHWRGKYSVAEQRYNEAEAIYSQNFGRLHPKAIECRYCRADLAYKQGNPEGALAAYEEAQKDFETIYGAEDSKVAACMNNRANLLKRMKKLDEAEALASRALAIHMKRIGPEHAMIASDLNLLGTIHRDQGQLDEAERLHRESLAMRLKLFKPDNEMVGTSRLMLGVCLARMSRFEDAESEMLEAIRIYESHSRDENRALDAYEHVANLYALWGKPEKEAHYRQLIPAADRPTPGSKP